ncbi:hypothetical protein GCM10023189_15180 [Nibrella saemangeumensis]|uniref:ABC transporter substrate-binding protein n=1 Tax=Nibrella saemangeumensis TaxID=1084526 RepID=A0ABP8MKF5_9BACT
MKNQISKGLSLVLFALALGCTNPDTVAPDQTSGARTEATAKKATSALSAPITGTVDGSSFSGVFTISRFIEDGSQVLAVGTISNIKGKKLSGSAVKTITSQQWTLPVSFPSMGTASLGDITAQATCEILELTLGPLDLNLLGLVVHLDQVNLTIDAQSGSGNLLGNLLCAVAGLLDPVSFLANLAQIVDLLNQIVGVLQGL